MKAKAKVKLFFPPKKCATVNPKQGKSPIATSQMSVNHSLMALLLSVAEPKALDSKVHLGTRYRCMASDVKKCLSQKGIVRPVGFHEHTLRSNTSTGGK